MNAAMADDSPLPWIFRPGSGASACPPAFGRLQSINAAACAAGSWPRILGSTALLMLFLAGGGFQPAVAGPAFGLSSHALRAPQSPAPLQLQNATTTAHSTKHSSFVHRQLGLEPVLASKKGLGLVPETADSRQLGLEPVLALSIGLGLVPETANTSLSRLDLGGAVTGINVTNIVIDSGIQEYTTPETSDTSLSRLDLGETVTVTTTTTNFSRSELGEIVTDTIIKTNLGFQEQILNKHFLGRKLQQHGIGSRITSGRSPLMWVGSHAPLQKIRQHPYVILALASLGVIGYMQPGGNSLHGSTRQPPAWSPEIESRYPFRHWARDIMVWSILNSDLDPRRKCAAVILQLRGGAEELVRGLPPQAIINGGQINGTAVDPMTFLMHSLSERYSQLGEETRLSAITDLMNFNRIGQERIDALITRFDTIRQRANQEGQLNISIQGLTWILLRACSVNDSQLMTLLQPFGGLFPATAEQYRTLCTLLRRMGHIIERSPGNIAGQLRQGGSQVSSFFETSMHEPDPWHQQPSTDPWASTFAQQSPSYPTMHPAMQMPTHSSTQQTHSTFPAFDDNYSDNGTDTDTVSSCFDQDLEMPAGIPATATQSEIGQHLFWAYQTAKATWRRFTGKHYSGQQVPNKAHYHGQGT